MKECKAPGMTRLACLKDEGTDIRSCEWMKKLKTEPPAGLILMRKTVERAEGCPFQKDRINFNIL